MTLSKNLLLGCWKGLSPVIAASSEAPGYPASRLSSQRISVGWRTVVGVIPGVTLDFTHSSSVPIGAVSLVGNNFSDTATLRVKYSDTALGNVDKGDTGVVNAFDLTYADLRRYTPPWGRTSLVLPAAALSARYVRVLIEDPSNAYGYLAVGVASAEDAFQPATNVHPVWPTDDRLRGEPGAQVALRGSAFT